jgi:flavorubredoxin
LNTDKKEGDNMNLAKSQVLYEDEDHKYIWLGWAEGYEEGIIQTNQYLIINKGRGILLDPGGVHLFSKVVSEISRYIDLESIDTIIFSHQDPDVSSGIALWLGITDADIYIPGLWTRFVPHFGIVDIRKIVPVATKGTVLPLPSGKRLIVLPAHFLHSTGNFSVYDETSEILFSGDIGAAVLGKENRYLFVEDFQAHLRIMEPFHVRYMASNTACREFSKFQTDPGEIQCRVQ